MKGKAKAAAMVLIGAALVLAAGCQAPGGPAEARFSDSFIKQVAINAPPEAVWAYMFVEGINYD